MADKRKRKRFKVTIFVESTTLSGDQVAERFLHHYDCIRDSYLVVPDDINVERVPDE